jgi:DNA invertase Pin-like site-specific DNA recombinase
VNRPSKITRSHLERSALIYIRQSSLAQVRENTESTARQYALADEAVTLGWDRGQVQVIDADLGRSGRSAQGRDGYRDLVAQVCLGEVGAIFGLEVSRLARSTADLSRLLELARLTDTLVIDGDGVYDLTDFNDRLLLGLKGSMSEAELHLLAGRLQGAKRAAAARGELRTPLPVGYVYDDEGRCVMDPDAEVQAAIADVFTTFTATGSGYATVAAFAGRRFPLRAYGGAWAGQLRWGRLTHARVLGVLNNPAYAGAYVYGRYTTKRRVQPDGSVKSTVTLLPRPQWAVLIQEHHDAFISWADHLTIEAKLATNRTNAGARPPREGVALCQGILACGSCARPMSTRYHRNGHPAYECTSRQDLDNTPTCRSIAASTVDDAVVTRLLAALTPNEVSLAFAAADQVEQRRSSTTRAAELAVERARYETDRAERAFHAAEPENRLVTRNLETAGSTDSPLSPRPKRRCKQPAMPYHRRPTGPPCRHWSPTCHDYGMPTPPARKTANGCYAPSSPTSPSYPSRTRDTPGSGSAGIPALPTRSPPLAMSTPEPRNALQPPRSNWSSVWAQPPVTPIWSTY